MTNNVVISFAELKQICPFASRNADVFISYLNKYMPKFGIASFEAVTAFIAQVAQESGSFRYVRELASGKAYEGRADLGNIYRDDGVLFKGRGLIQITGRDNYRKCSIALFGDERLQQTPQLLEAPEYAVMSACWFWQEKGLTEIAEQPELTYIWNKKKRTFFEWITIKINGALTHIEERKAFFERAKTALSV